MMRKIIFGLIFALSFLLTGTVAASDHCFDFGGYDEVCLSVDKNSSSRFHFDATVRGSGIAICHVETPDGRLQLIDDCDDTFSYHGNGSDELKIYVRYDNQYKTWDATYDFGDGRFVGRSTNYSRNYNHYNNYNNYSRYNSSNLDGLDVEASDSRPRVNELVDITIAALDSRSYREEDFEGRVTFSIDERRNGSRSRASSHDYDMDFTSYSFDRYDNGFKRFNNFLRFEDDGNFRLKVSADGVVEYVYFTVGDGSSYNNNSYYYNNDYYDHYNASTLKKFSLRVDDTTPRTDQDLDLTIQPLDRYGDRIENFRKSVYFSVQEKSGSSWRTASTRDYDLSRTSYTFRSSDDGYVVLRDLISFDTSGNYRLKVRSSDGVIGYIYLNVSRSSTNSYRSYNSSHSYNSNNGFTTSELRIVRRVYNQWGSYIAGLERDFPRLRSNSSWQRMESDLYYNMGNVLNDRSSVWNDYDDYYGDFLIFVSYTISAR